jgi:hypothetical protein
VSSIVLSMKRDLKIPAHETVHHTVNFFGCKDISMTMQFSEPHTHILCLLTYIYRWKRTLSETKCD